MTRVGLTRANQLCKRKPISEDTVSRMAAFERHRENSKIDEKYKGTPWKDRGYVAWLGWGGDEGIAWAKRKKEQFQFKKWRSKPNSSNVKNIMYNDETNELVLQFRNGDNYTYFNVPFNLFEDVVNGNGVCRTEGSNRWGSWSVGKTPSVGAAVYRRLVESGIMYIRGGNLR
jgi:hypothetical protein